MIPPEIHDLATTASGQQQQLDGRRWVRIARLLRFGIECFGQPRDLGFRQKALDLPDRRFLDTTRWIVGAQAAADREGIDRTDQSDALRGGALAANSDAARTPFLGAREALSRLSGGNGIPHALDLGAPNAIGPQLAEQWAQVVFDSAPIDF